MTGDVGSTRAMVLIAIDSGHGSTRRDDVGPKTEFGEIARLTDASIESFTSGCAQRATWFGSLFGKWPKIGAAVHATFISGNFDAIYVTGEDLGIPLAALLRLRRWRGRLICVFHNLTPRKRLLMRLIGGTGFYRLVTVSDMQRDLLTRELGIDTDRVVNTRNWVDTDFFQPDFSVPSGGYLIACGAENRDYATLAEAAWLTSRKIKIYGHGFLNAGSAEAGPIPDNYELCPRVTYEVLRAEYARATGVIIPLNSVAYAAGVTGLVEAMAMGKPIIVSRSIGIADYLEAGRPGIEVDPGSAVALATAIESLATDPKNYASIGARNRAWAVDNCSLEAYAALITSIMTGG
jgi:glycosyltransferase involved in cell wall biosynthesis